MSARPHPVDDLHVKESVTFTCLAGDFRMIRARCAVLKCSLKRRGDISEVAGSRQSWRPRHPCACILSPGGVTSVPSTGGSSYAEGTGKLICR